MSRQQFEQYINTVTLLPEEREYVKRVMERFDEPTFSMGITREEFFKHCTSNNYRLTSPPKSFYYENVQ